MNLYETYSHYCGVPRGNPFIWQEYFSIPYDRYIVFQAGAGMPSKQYTLWEHVIEHIKVPVVQVGGKDDQALPVSLDLRGKTTWNQTAHILARASLFLGCDSICNHMASAFGISRVALFGATSPYSCGGVWNKDKGIEITPNDMRGCYAPCHFDKCIRPQRCIDSIKPETVLQHIAQWLGKDSITEVEIPHIGSKYELPIVEWIPFSCEQNEFNIFQSIAGAVNVHLEHDSVDLKSLSNFCNALNLKYIFFIKPSEMTDFTVSTTKTEIVFILADKENIGDATSCAKHLASKFYRTRIMSRSPHSEFTQWKADMIDLPPMELYPEYKVSEGEVEKFVGKSYNLKTKRKIIANNAKFYLTLYDAVKKQNEIAISTNNSLISIEKEHLREADFFILRNYAKSQKS